MQYTGISDQFITELWRPRTIRGCLHVRQNVVCGKNRTGLRSWWRLLQVRDGAAKPELIDSCAVRGPALFCRTRCFVAHVGTLLALFLEVTSLTPGHGETTLYVDCGRT